jgi:hypothetical protein
MYNTISTVLKELHIGYYKLEDRGTGVSLVEPTPHIVYDVLIIINTMCVTSYQ